MVNYSRCRWCRGRHTLATTITGNVLLSPPPEYWRRGRSEGPSINRRRLPAEARGDEDAYTHSLYSAFRRIEGHTAADSRDASALADGPRGRCPAAICP